MDSYRQLLQLLLEAVQRENLTAILSHEVTSVAQQAVAFGRIPVRHGDRPPP